MKMIFMAIVFAMANISYSQTSKQEKPIKYYSDIFIYKVSDVVYSLQDLKKLYYGVQGLKCAYPRSIIVKVFAHEFALSNQKYFSFNKTGELTQAQKKYYERLLIFTKMLIYTRGHSDPYEAAFKKAIKIHGIKNRCSARNFKSKDSLNSLVKLESFLRSRFLPQEKNEQETLEDINKSVDSIHNFVKSINQQIDQEVYW